MIFQINRREFLGAASAASSLSLPVWRSSPKSSEHVPLFDNYMPHFQFLTNEIAAGLSYSTGFDFTSRLVKQVDAVRFGKLLRGRLLRIQRAARKLFGCSLNDGEQTALKWLARKGSADRILRLEAFVRNGAFRIENRNGLLVLTAEM